jgi:hypothetical protein
MNITGNIISGRVMGETAKQLSERFGRILQERESISINRVDTSLSRSRQLDLAIPTSRIASLSSGEFVGMVADNPLEKIRLKMFHAEIVNKSNSLREESKLLKSLPKVSDVSVQQIMDNYHQVKLDVKRIISLEVGKLVAGNHEGE